MNTSPGLLGIDEKQEMLKRMSPEQLHQYAMTHRDDVIALSLVSAVQSQRNKAQQAAQMQQGQQGPQAKVVDQLVQSIPAESAGLPTLPARNMAMADGGIVGYAGGGKVPGEEYLRSTSGGRDWDLEVPEEVRNPTVPYYAMLPNPARALAGRKFGSREEALAAYKQAMTSGAPEASAVRAADRAQYALPPTSGVEAPEVITAPTAGPTTGTKAAPPPPGAGGSASQSLRMSRSTSGPAGGASAGDVAAMYAEAQKLAGVGKEVDPAAAQRAELLANRQAQKQRVIEDTKAQEEGLQALLKPKEERIDRREAALKKQTEHDTDMALIKGFLTLAGTSGQGLSGLLSGITAGAEVGIKQYGEAMNLSKAERQKIDDARDAYDELKFNSANMSRKDRTAAENALAEAANTSTEKAIDAIAEQRKVTRGEAKTLLEQWVAQQIAADRNKTDVITAGMRASAGGAGGGADKQQLAELKLKQTGILSELNKIPAYGGDKVRRATLQRELDAVKTAIDKMAGLDTIETSPGAAKSASALKYNPATGKIE